MAVANHRVRNLCTALFQGALLLVLVLGLPREATAAIQQVSVLPGRPDSGSLVVQNAVSPLYASFPSSLSFDVVSGGNTVRHVLMGWQRSSDGPGTVYSSRAKSTDGGLTFGTPTHDNLINYFRSIKKRDGTLLSLPFNPGMGPWTYWTSTDNGATWPASTNGTMSPAMVIHTDFIEENDGTLYTCGYGGGNSKLMKSTNGGVAWTFVSNIAPVNVPTSGLSYSETTIARCMDGSWLAIIRVDVYQSMRYARSTNQGVSWSTPALVPGITSNGVDPRLFLMPNGIMALTWGDHVGVAARNVKIAFSENGNGTSWTNVQTLLTGVSDVLESTGYNVVHPMGPNRLMMLYDTGSHWNYSTPYDVNKFKVRGQIIDVVPTHTNRIDLKGRVAAGTATITGDLTYSNAAHPEARTAGAYDGSTDYWSGAFKSGTSGSYTVDLQSARKLNAVGVSLQKNTLQSATVDISTNGSTWTTVKIYNSTNGTLQAINYTGFTAQSARYVRVSVSGAGPLVSLNELELYETADTFENNAVAIDADAHGPIPPGYVWAGTSSTEYGFAVRDSATNAGYQSSRSFQLWDGSSFWQAGIIKTTTGAQTKKLEFRVKPQAWGTDAGSCLLIPIKGTVSGVQNTVFYLLIAKNGSIMYHNGSTWNTVTGCGAGTIPTNAWSLVTFAASNSTDVTAVSVNGTFKGNATMYANPANVTDLKSFALASQGTPTFGEKALFDNILFE